MSCNLRLDIKYGQVENSDSESDMNSRSLGKPSTNRYRETNESTYYDTSPAYTNKRRKDIMPTSLARFHTPHFHIHRTSHLRVPLVLAYNNSVVPLVRLQCQLLCFLSVVATKEHIRLTDPLA